MTTNILKYQLFSFLIAIAFLFFISCSKNSSSSTDITRPVITMAEPMPDDTSNLSVEPEVHVEFTVTDEVGLHELSVLVIKNNTDTLMNETPSVSDLKVYAFHEHLIPAGIIATVPFKAIIKASDHAGNVQSTVVNFYVTP
jgi:hypothetical protein